MDHGHEAQLSIRSSLQPCEILCLHLFTCCSVDPLSVSSGKIPGTLLQERHPTSIFHWRRRWSSGSASHGLPFLADRQPPARHHFEPVSIAWQANQEVVHPVAAESHRFRGTHAIAPCQSQHKASCVQCHLSIVRCAVPSGEHSSRDCADLRAGSDCVDPHGWC
jgi:hypothetical protein